MRKKKKKRKKRQRKKVKIPRRKIRINSTTKKEKKIENEQEEEKKIQNEQKEEKNEKKVQKIDEKIEIEIENEIEKKEQEEKIKKENINKSPEIKTNIHISYNGTGKINLEDIQNQKNLELIHKQQNIFLGNELTLLKCKLNKVRKENEFLQSLIHEKGMVKNTNVLEKFIGGFVERLSLNWDNIVNNIIDEIILDEIHELNEIELNKINYEKCKPILINNLFKNGITGLIPQKSDELNKNNTDLLFSNIEIIRRILNSVDETEKNIRKKYNIK